jgi:hypothetical protein
MSDEIRIAEGEGAFEEATVEEQQLLGDVIPDEETADRIMNYVIEEVGKITSGDENQKMRKNWEKWRRQREARPESDSKSYPWPGASNVSVPLAMMNGNGIFAMLKASMGTRKPFYRVASSTREEAGIAESIGNLLNILVASPHHINLPAVNDTILYELATMGTQFVKIPWVIDRWQFKRATGSGALETVTVTRKNGPGVIPVRLEDFICRPFYDDLQRAPLIGQRLYLFEHELKQRAAQGIYRNVDQVLEHGSSEIDEDRMIVLEKIGIDVDTGRDNKMYEIWELYLFDDIDGDGVPEDIIVWVDPVGKVFLRTEFNDLGIRPWVRFPYLERPYQLYAIGTGWMSEHLQDEIDTLHNMRIDGTHIASLQMYVTRQGSNMASQDSFRPLKNIVVDDPRNDFMPIKFPDISGGTLQAEMLAKEYADRVTGASDAMMGFESQTIGSRATASGTMFLAQQGSRLFNAIQNSVEHAFAEVAKILVYQFVRNADIVRQEFYPLLSAEDQANIDIMLQMGVQDIPTKFRFSVTTTDVDETKEAQKQAKLTLTQLYTMYGEKVFSLLPMIYGQQQQVPPQIKEVAAQFFVGSTKLMQDIFESFGEQNADDYLPYVKDLEMMVKQLEMMKNQAVSQQLGGGGENVRSNSGEVRAVGGTGQRPPQSPVGPGMEGGPEPSGPEGV